VRTAINATMHVRPCALPTSGRKPIDPGLPLSPWAGSCLAAALANTFSLFYGRPFFNAIMVTQP